MNATYTRGTKTGLVTAHRLIPGTVVLTTDCPANPEFALIRKGAKTGATLRTVARTERVDPRRDLGERNVRIVTHFTDGTRSGGEGSATTWMVVERPAAEIVAEEAGRVAAEKLPTVEEIEAEATTRSPYVAKKIERAAVAEANEQAARLREQEETPAEAKKAARTSACLHCNLPTKGGSYLPGHDAKHAVALAAELAQGGDPETVLAGVSVPLRAKIQRMLNRG